MKRSSACSSASTSTDIDTKPGKIVKSENNDIDQTEVSKTVAIPPVEPAEISSRLLSLELSLCQQLEALNFVQEPISHVYNPLQYAVDPHRTYLQRYGNTRKEILFVGMNPGPFGMAQTGVPFGTVTMVRDWLKISGEVGAPPVEHPSRPIKGFSCKREEVSGTRFWQFFQDLCGTPENFFRSCLVYNHCPLVFMAQTGKNVSAADLPKTIKHQVYDHCDRTLVQVAKLCDVKHLVCIGKYAEKRSKEALKGSDLEIEVHTLLHPSPQTLKSSEEWKTIARDTLADAGLLDIICKVESNKEST